MNTPTPEQIQSELEQILASPGFTRSERLMDFLEYVVAESLAGRGAQIKEYTIGVEVYGRPTDFEPQADSIVRVEAGRLRAKLVEYYATTGQNNLLRISLPKGHYTPAFELRPENVARQPRHKWTAVVAGVVVVIALLMFGSVNIFDETPETTFETVSLAVLPMQNLSGDPNQDYLSDGITDALIRTLARHPQIRVTSYISVIGFKNSKLPKNEIAQQLNVKYLIDGAVLRTGERMRILARLSESDTGNELWGHTFDTDRGMLSKIREDIADRIIAELVKPLPAFAQTQSQKYNPSTEAYDAYLRGRHYQDQVNEYGFNNAIEHFEQAILIDPEYANAYAALASCHCLLGGLGLELLNPVVNIPQAKKFAEQALALDPNSVEAIAVLGIINLKYEWNWAESERLLLRAMELNPSDFRSKLWYSQWLEAMGQHSEAVEFAHASLVLSPMSKAANLNYGWQLLANKQLDAAYDQFMATQRLVPEFWGSYWALGYYHLANNETELAIQEFHNAVNRRGGSYVPIASLAYVNAITGNELLAHQGLDDLLNLKENTYVSPFHIATVYIGLGDMDTAFQWLEKAFVGKSRSLAWLNVTREYDAIRSTKRFKDLTLKVGLPVSKE